MSPELPLELPRFFAPDHLRPREVRDMNDKTTDEYIWLDGYLGAVGFLLPGHDIGVGCVPGAPDTPRMPYQCLYLMFDARMVRMIRGPEDLTGHVHITSPTMALRYVRLFTSPATAHMFADPWCEVVSAEGMDVLDRAFFFGQTYPEPLTLIEMSHKDADRMYGILRADEWRDHGMRSPETECTADGYVVRRMLFRIPAMGGTRVSYWIAERVFADGRVSKTRLGKVRLRQRLHFDVLRETH